MVLISPNSEFFKDCYAPVCFRFAGFLRQNNVTVLRIVLKIVYLCSHNRNCFFCIRLLEKVDGYAKVAIILYLQRVIATFFLRLSVS